MVCKMTEEGVGIGTVTSWTAIIIVAIVLGFVLINVLFADTKDAFFDVDEIKKIAEEELSTDVELDVKEANRVSDKFEEVFNTAGNDCIVNLDIADFDNRLNVHFKDGVMRIFNEDFREFIVRRNLDVNIYFNDVSNNDFILKRFSKADLGRGEERLVLLNSNGPLIFYKSSNGDFYLYDSNILADIIGDKIECKSLEQYDLIANKYRNGEITQAEYLISLIKFYYEMKLNGKVLDTYYRLYRLADQDILDVNTGQWTEINLLRNEILSDKEGDWRLCMDKRDDVFRCFDLTIPIVSLNDICSLELGQIPDTIPKYDNLRNCENERVNRIGVLPAVDL